MTNGDTNKLEAFVDKYGLSDVMMALADVCSMKATHLLENWQDARLSKVWDKNAEVIADCSTQVNDTIR